MEQDMDVHLRRNDHQATLLSVFSSLLDNGNLVDCTIGAEGQYFKAHRVILSACSPYFELLFSQHYEKHPIVILPDVKFHMLKALMDFMYSGEMKVPQDKLNTVLKLAETLEIKGLSFAGDTDTENEPIVKRRNESAIPPEQQGFTEYQCEPRYGTQVGQTEDRSLPHLLNKEYTAGLTSLPLATQKYGKDNSNCVSTGKTVEDPAMSQDAGDTKDFNVFQSSSLTQTSTKSSSRVSETLLNSVSNILGTAQFPESSEGNNSEQRVSNKNMLSSCSSSDVLGTLEPLARPVSGMQPDIKQDDADDFNGCTVEEIILDDDSDELDYGNSEDNTTSVGELVKVLPEDSFHDQDFSTLGEQHRDKYFMCDICGRSYRYRRGLLRHWKYECGKERQFKCPHCPARRTRKDQLKSHMKKIHSSY